MARKKGSALILSEQKITPYLQFSAGGLNADCQTLSEIRRWNRPEVAEFVEEIYSAEFSPLSVKETEKYFKDAGRLVMIWR